MIVTSISLPEFRAAVWRRNKSKILQFAGAFLQAQSADGIKRGVTRRYNRGASNYLIVTVRFSEQEYDAFHCVAAALRISVSALIYELIQMWQNSKPASLPFKILTNYHIRIPLWNEVTRVIEERLVFSSTSTPPAPTG